MRTHHLKRIREVGLAAVGDEFFIRGIRLLGVGKVLVIGRSLSSSEILDRIRRFVENLDDVGLLVVQDNLRPYFEQLSNVITIPQVIYLPNIKDLDKLDVRKYYLSLLKHYLGLSLEV